MDTKTQYPDKSDYNGYPSSYQPPQNNPPPHFAEQPPQYVAVPTFEYIAPPPKLSWFKRNQKNKPQSNSVGIASLIFTTGGMNIAWASKTDDTRIYCCMTGWFIGAILGAIIGAILSKLIQKKIILLFSAFMVTLSGILFLTLSKQYSGLIAARYINGLAVGLAFAPILVMAGEIADKSVRGMIASSVEAMSFSVGFYLQFILNASWSEGYNSNSVMGLCIILFGALSFLLGLCLIIESPVFLLVRGKEQEAIDSLRRLQRPLTITQETIEQLEEHKRYIEENKQLTLVQSAIQGLPALLKLCFYRIMVALSFSAILTYVTWMSVIDAQLNPSLWPIIVNGTCRWLGALIGAFIVDSAGRKKPMILGMLICGGMAIGVGVSFSFDGVSDSIFRSKMGTAMYLLFIYQFFAGLSLTSSSAYLSEAFPLAIKSYYIAAAFVVEMLVQIIILSIRSIYMPAYFFALAALYFAYVVFGFVSMPETKQMTLREAQKKFRKFKSN